MLVARTLDCAAALPITRPRPDARAVRRGRRGRGQPSGWLRNACLVSATSAESAVGMPAGDLQELPLLPGAREARDERDRDGLNAANTDTAASSADKIPDSGALSVAPEPRTCPPWWIGREAPS